VLPLLELRDLLVMAFCYLPNQPGLSSKRTPDRSTRRPASEYRFGTPARSRANTESVEVEAPSCKYLPYGQTSACVPLESSVS
jgi:hypothetical protein